MTATPRTAPSAFPTAEQAAAPARGRASGRGVPARAAGPRRPAGGRGGRLTAALLGATLLALPLAACGEAENGADGAGGTVDTDTTPTAGGTSDTDDATEGADEGETENAGATGDTDGEAEGAADGDAGTDAGTDVPEPASTDDPMVFNYFGAEDGRADRAPDNLVLTEFSTLNDVTWESWNGEEAIGSGLLAGTWCLPDCLDDPFPAEVVLKDPEDINGEPYFTAFELEITDPSGYSQEMVEAAETEGFLGRP